MKRYTVKRVFGPTLQGEGSLTGAVTTFVRFAGCNVWDGRPESKAASACPYCDTDFVGGARMTAADIVEAIARTGLVAGAWVTVSGGEPLLQLDRALVSALHEAGWKVAIETNGTRLLGDLTGVVDHVTVSPKLPPAETVIERADDLKVLVPHPDQRITPAAFDEVERFKGARRWMQPVNAVDELDPLNIARTVSLILATKGAGDWRLSLQVHKLIGVE